MSNAIGTAVENKAEAAPVRVFVGEIGGEPTSACDARELHAYLEVARDFSTWLNERIERYGFEENRDFALVPRNGGIKKGRGGDRRSKDYYLSLDMAKELGMVENSGQGRKIRRYFIECEKQLREMARDVADSVLTTTIGADGFRCLSAVVDGKVNFLPAPVRRQARAKLWSQLRAAFGVRRSEDIPANQIDAARTFVAAYNVREGEWIPREKIRRVGRAEWSNIGCLIHCVEETYAIFERYRLYHYLDGLGCRAGADILGQLWDGLGSAAHVKKHCANELASVDAGRIAA